MDATQFYRFIAEEFIPFLEPGKFDLFGGIARKYLESSELEIDAQKRYICEYLKNGGDIDILVNKIDQLGINQLGISYRDYRSAQMESILKSRLAKYGTLISAEMVSGYTSTSVKIKLQLNTNYGKNINLAIDVVEKNANDIKLDFDVNSLVIDDKGISIRTIRQFVSSSKTNQDMDMIKKNIKSRTCKIVLPDFSCKNYRGKQRRLANQMTLKRVVKMFNNGYVSCPEDYDELCCIIDDHSIIMDDIIKLDSYKLINHILNHPNRLLKFIETYKLASYEDRSRLRLYKKYPTCWMKWLVIMTILTLKYDMFDKFKLFIRHFSDFNSEDAATTLFERLADDHFEDYLWIMNEVGYGHHKFYSLDLRYIQSNMVALGFMHKRTGNFDKRKLESATYSSFETFQFVYSRMAKKQTKGIDWDHLSRVSLLGDYRTMKWIKDNKGIDPELNDEFWSNYRNEFRFDLYNYVSKEMYSDQFMYKLCKKFMFTPAILTLEGIASRINPIFIEWYLGLHYNTVNISHLTDMLVILDILVDYDEIVVLDYTMRYNLDQNIKNSLLQHIQTHASRMQNIMESNISFDENQALRIKK